MADDDASKTEEPTGKKIAKARSEGQVAMSQEIKSWVILLGSTLIIFMMAPGIARDLRVLAAAFIERPESFPFDQRNLQLMFTEVSVQTGLILAPTLGVLFLLAIVANVGQTGFVYSPKKISPKLSKLSIIKGFSKIIGVKAMIEFVKGIIKLIAVSVVAFGLTLPLLNDVTLIPELEISQSLERIHLLAVQLMIGTVVVMTVIAALDIIYQRYSFNKQQKMSKQEVKDEHRQSEGDPQIKARIRQLRVQRARQRMMAAVPEADVVITNPTHYAVALCYDMEAMPAPKLVAKGVDSLAQRIREVAEANDIPIIENPPLARALYAAVELDEEIPQEHYKAVAEIIGYVMRLKGKMQGA